MPPDLKLVGAVAGADVAGAAGAAKAALSPLEIVLRMGDPWLSRAPATERAELLRVILKNDRFPKSLLRMLEGEMGEKILNMPHNKIPRAIMNAAGSSKKQARLTQTLRMLRGGKSDKAIAGDVRKLFGLAVRGAEQAGIPADRIAALKAFGPEEVLKAGPANVLRVHDMATKESTMQRFIRWATRGDPVLSGKKSLGTGPTQNLVASARAQLDDLLGIEKTKISEEVAAAKGVFGKGKAAVKGAAGVAGEAISPKGMDAAEQGILSRLTKTGAKGLGRGAKMARGMGGLGAVIGLPLMAHAAYDSLVGKSKRARAAFEANRRGGTVSTSQELMYDILDKRADLQARRAMLSRDPQLMQQIVQSLSGPQAKTLTSSEAGFGVDVSQQGVSPGEMDKLLNQLLGQMRGM